MRFKTRAEHNIDAISKTKTQKPQGITDMLLEFRTLIFDKDAQKQEKPKFKLGSSQVMAENANKRKKKRSFYRRKTIVKINQEKEKNQKKLAPKIRGSCSLTCIKSQPLSTTTDIEDFEIEKQTFKKQHRKNTKSLSLFNKKRSFYFNKESLKKSYIEKEQAENNLNLRSKEKEKSVHFENTKNVNIQILPKKSNNSHKRSMSSSLSNFNSKNNSHNSSLCKENLIMEKNNLKNMRQNGYLLASSFAYPNYKAKKMVYGSTTNGFGGFMKKKKNQNFKKGKENQKIVIRDTNNKTRSTVYKGSRFGSESGSDSNLFNLQRILLAKNYQKQKFPIKKDFIEEKIKIKEKREEKRNGALNNSKETIKSINLETLTTNQSFNYLGKKN